MNAKELNSNGNIVLTKDAKMFKKLENENAKLKAELAEYKDVISTAVDEVNLSFEKGHEWAIKKAYIIIDSLKKEIVKLKQELAKATERADKYKCDFIQKRNELVLKDKALELTCEIIQAKLYQRDSISELIIKYLDQARENK